MFSYQQHRHFYLLIGNAEQRITAFNILSQHLHAPFVSTLHPASFPAQAALTQHALPCLAFNKLTHTLGLTCEALLFDIEQGISANSLAIAAGTVCGGGLFAIGVPDIETWLTLTDDDMARYLPWPLTSDKQPSYFKHYFLQHLHQSALSDTHQPTHANLSNRLQTRKLEQANALDKLVALPAITQLNSPTLQLNDEQSLILSQLKTQIATHLTTTQTGSSQATFLTAHRGRGKSSLLGILIAQLLNMGYRPAVTAPRKKALQTLAHHFQQAQDDTMAELPFYAADALLKFNAGKTATHTDILIVDEAAAFPLSMLEQFTKHFRYVIYSSTDHGYESGGKGFGLRLAKQLQQQGTKITHHTLAKPVRWQTGDYLEKWLDSLLFLYANEKNKANKSGEKTGNKTSKIESYQGSTWLTQFDQLADLFHLLINAHYQTSPNDIRWILDDPTTHTWTYSQQEKLHSAAIVTTEGPIQPSMAQAILEGKRRPRGHLLPQSLLAHEGHQKAGDFCYWRISRIATSLTERRQGWASHLLTAIEQAAKQQNIDFLCASFAATHSSLAFWQANGFYCVRLGTSKDQASGCYSAMMLKALNKQAEQTARDWHQHYLDNLIINVPRDYQDLPTNLAQQLTISMPEITTTPLQQQTFSAKDKQDLWLFCQHNRPYLSIRAQLTRLIQWAIQQQHLIAGHSHYALLTTTITTPTNNMDFSEFGLTSKKNAERQLKTLVAELLCDTPS